MRRVTAVAFGTVLLAAQILPGQAVACRMEIPSQLDSFSKAVVVSVPGSKRVPNPSFNIWHIVATPKRSIVGSPVAKTYSFNGGTGSNGCNDDPPKPGDLWVLYLQPGSPDGVDQAYPLDYVRRYDPRLISVR
jgi:hypothetical protein